MNYEDVINPDVGLIKDQWTLTGPTFGSDGQLKVLGWSLKNSKGNKFYVVRCDYCSKDVELFGGGFFRSRKTDLMRFLPCGCSPSPRWSKEQHYIMCKRKAVELGHEFLGFVGPWKASKTKAKLRCKEHGVWESTILSSLYIGRSCKRCSDAASGFSKRKSDEDMIKSFLDSGAFHVDTKFYRTDEKCSGAPYWRVDCPVCGEWGQSTSYNLQNGKMCCGCSTHNYNEGYINLIKDGSQVIAVKFGITKSSNKRVRQQNARSAYLIENYEVYKFPDSKSCRKAEQECKSRFECGIILRRDMMDGWSETTWSYNLEEIACIYKSNGGVKL